LKKRKIENDYSIQEYLNSFNSERYILYQENFMVTIKKMS